MGDENFAFLHGDYGSAPTSLAPVILALLLAFVLGPVIAWLYVKTHAGLAYSRSFVVTLIFTPVVVALALTVLSDSLVIACGLMAIFAVVRFRNLLRDTLDASYILAAFVIGTACGLQKFSTAILGTGGLMAILLYLWRPGLEVDGESKSKG